MSVLEADLLVAVQNRSGSDSITQDYMDQALPELMSYLLAGPAICKKNDWTEWDLVSSEVQHILIGVLARQAAMGQGTIAEERVGDYSVRYSDPSLFEGRIPRFFNDGEEHAIGKLAGCFSTLYSIDSGSLPLHDFGRPEVSTTRDRLAGVRLDESLGGK